MSSTAAVIAVLEGNRFRFMSEVELQEAVAAAFAGAGLQVTREHRITAKDRVDFFVDGTAIELKIAGTPANVARQLLRYAASPTVRELVLATTVASHVAQLPDRLSGKPLHVVHVHRAGGLA